MPPQLDSPDDLRNAFMDFARAGKVGERDEYDFAHKLAVVVYDYLHVGVADIVNTQPALPMLISYQSDATSYKTKQRLVRRRILHKVIIREGMELTEFLLERLFVKVASPVDPNIAAIKVFPPRLLTEGKKT